MKTHLSLLPLVPTSRLSNLPGRLRLAAVAMAAAIVACLGCGIATAIPGSYDLSFNVSGVVTHNVGPGEDIARALAVQPDGKILVAGSCAKTAGTSARDWCIARYYPSGLSDHTFAGTGVTKLIAQLDQFAAGIAVASNGDIIVAGTCESKFCVYRLNATGSVYTNFGTFSPSGGRATFLPPGVIIVSTTTMLLQTDGRIVLGGQCYNNNGVESICIARFNANGSFDDSFGTASGTGTQFGFFTGQSYLLGGLALQSDGKIVYAASLNSATNYNFVRGRLNSNGTFDSGYMTNIIAASGTGTSLARSVALQADGKALLGGFCSVGSSHRFCIARVLANDGALDTSYGTGGFVVMPDSAINGGDGLSIVVQPDGKAILSGTWGGNFTATRHNDDGSLDTTYGNGGITFGVINNGDKLYASILQPDGKLIWAGRCNFSNGISALCVQRLDGGPFNAAACTPDVDGDGRVLAHTDMLILSRVRLGITGAAAIAGVGFQSSAPRNTWPLIRQYLVAHCGLTVKE